MGSSSGAEKLAKSLNWRKRLSALDDPNCPAHVIDQLVRDKRHGSDFADAALNNVSTGPETLDFIARTFGFPKTLRVATHTATSDSTLLRLAREGNSAVKESLLKRFNLPDSVASVLAEDPSSEIRGLLAQRSDCPREVLEELSSDSDWVVQVHVVRNPACPATAEEFILESLSRSAERRARICSTSRSRRITPERRARLVADSDAGVRMNVATRTDLTLEEFQTLGRDPEGYVVREVARNPTCPSILLEELARENSPWGHAGLLTNSGISSELRASVELMVATGGGDKIPPAEWLDENVARYTLANSEEASREILLLLSETEIRVIDFMKTQRQTRESLMVLLALASNAALPGEWKTRINEAQSRLVAVGKQLPDVQIPQRESPPEELFWEAYQSSAIAELAGLRPQVQVGIYRVDFGIPSKKLAVEVDGLAFHNGQDSFQRDRDRQRDLEMQGWRVLRFTALEVQRNPDECVLKTAEWVKACE